MTASKVAGYRIERGGAWASSALPSIDVAANALFPEEDLPAPQREHGLPQAFFEDAAREGRLYVARQAANRLPVGFAVTTRVDGFLHLFQLSVLPDHGRRGVGRALVEEVVERARHQAEGAVTLTTFRHLAWNAPFYEKLGFVALKAGAPGPELTACLEKEARDGLDPAKRVAMRLDLT